jgi:hypothetical protein
VSNLPVSAVEVRRQIWESLVSMLRVYAHAAGLNQDAYGVASNAEAAWVTYAESTLHIQYSPKTGDAHWSLEKSGHDAKGDFQIDENGQVVFPEGRKELDQAAIDWVQQLGQPTCSV